MFLVTLHTDEKSFTEDVRLWKSLLEGNQSALARLFKKYYRPLLNYGLKLIPRENLIKDSIQELFLTFWEQKIRLSEVEHIRSYLYRSFRRTVFRQAEIQNVRRRRDYSYWKESFNEMINQEDLLVLKELKQHQREQLRQALEVLSKRQKEAIFLKFYNGLSNSEIAKVMEVNKQSVYNYVHRAIVTLQKSLDR